MNGGQKAKPSWKKYAARARLWHPRRRLRKTIQRHMTSRDTVDYLNPSKISPMKIELVNLAGKPRESQRRGGQHGKMAADYHAKTGIEAIIFSSRPATGTIVIYF